MTQLYHRRDQGSPLSIAQADENLDHLGQIQVLTSNTVLNTGGDYVSNGGLTHTLPSDGNKFAMTITAGAVSYIGGTIEGVTNPTISESGRRVYGRIAGDWKLLSATSSTPVSTNFKVYDANVTADVANPWIWVKTPVARIVTIPDGLPDDTSFAVVREGAQNLSVVTSGVEVIVNPAGGTDTSVTLNESNRVLWFVKEGNQYRIAR